MLDPDVEDGIELYIRHIRQMNLKTDDELRMILRQKAILDAESAEALKAGAQKKALLDMKKIAKDIRTDSKKIARKVDKF